ncbi:MAG: tRNA (adenosine(37)-N6)-threonylcarbamoyltransferase complex dimerization subunit type 1 TsaB [Spirochaetaceae bacterium]|nr:tRNA (adenosine(37)-N6)-threonylcarbamoyltransferase complex dimerization subunit type 1 TsaB [Spirochaetaceae bacterium]
MLAIDCATEILSLALAVNMSPDAADLREKTKIYSMHIDAGKSHSELLFVVIDDLLKTAKLESRDIDLFVCQRGPGSWTGLRIGFSAVKGFALALDKPYLSIPTLDCMALSVPEADFEGIVLPVLDAKQSRFFWAIYENGKRQTDFLDSAPETISPRITHGKDIWLTGDAAQLLLPRLKESLESHYSSCGAHPESVPRIFLDPHFRKGWAEGLLNYLVKNPIIINKKESVSSVPIYLRKSDAEMSRNFLFNKKK